MAGKKVKKKERKKEEEREIREIVILYNLCGPSLSRTIFCADCFYGDGRGYRGNISSTVSGYKCQVWNEQFPHEHRNLSGEIYEEIRNSSNFCRNPGGYGLNGPCCFTTNRTVRWEYCDVPKCAKLGK